MSAGRRSYWPSAQRYSIGALLGIARAANAAGDRQKASEYYRKLVNLTKNADMERPETAEAKAFLASK